MSNQPFKLKAMTAALMIAGCQCAIAADTTASASSAQKLIVEEVMVYGTKRGASQSVQDVPAQVSAFGADQLEARQVVSLEDMSFSIPNVNLDGIGTIKGVANFSIRGMSLNSSVPSLDPAVGVFLDGVYSGSTYATILDTFDLENIEIFRGPQGVLFGRNVTGGAVLLRTARPDPKDGELHVKAKLGFETEDLLTTAVSVEAPLIDGVLAGKLTLYRSDDGGFHYNPTIGRDVGESETTFARGVMVYTPTDTLELTAIYEQGEMDGDGPVAQAPEGASPLDPSDRFVTNYDNPGFDKQEWQRLTLEANWDVGGGRLTNIFGWREIDVANQIDIDSSPIANFTSGLMVDQSQFSNEIRYNIDPVENWHLTVGAFYFEQEVETSASRIMRLSTANRIADPFDTMGITSQVPFFSFGSMDHSTWAVFMNNDFDITEAVTLTAGLRFSKEFKENVKIIPTGACTPTCPDGVGLANSPDKEWSNITPKVGVQWRMSDDVQLYAHWMRGFRSGGYNLRSALPNPPAFNEESQDSFEVGVKSTFADGRVRFNGALFHNTIDDLLRTTAIVVVDGLGNETVVQDTGNAANATVRGAELELSLLVTDNFGINLGVGILDAEYDKILSDLNRDGVVDGVDKALDFPRFPELTYNIEATYDFKVQDQGTVSSRLGYSFRDETFTDERNIGRLPEYTMVNAGISYTPDAGNWSVTLYGKNLTDEAPFNFVGSVGSSFAPGTSALYFAALPKGRRYGVEVKYDF